MKIKFLIASLFLFCNSAPAQNKALEKKIIDTIFRLKEVRERANYVEKMSKGKNHLGVAIYGTPSKDEPYYWVKAWEDNGAGYVTHFNFYVFPKPFTIKFYDMDNDTIITLKEWRRRIKQ
jgi:hypothetical protein